MQSEPRKPLPGDYVVLEELPRGLLDSLPGEAQQAISRIVGQPVRLNEYDNDRRAELIVTDRKGTIHFIYVSEGFFRIAGTGRINAF